MSNAASYTIREETSSRFSVTKVESGGRNSHMGQAKSVEAALEQFVPKGARVFTRLAKDDHWMKELKA